MLQIVIIGGGLQGITIFLNIPNELKKNTLIVDKYSKPLHLFYSRCDNIGMQYLRSPATHTMTEPISTSLFTYQKKYYNMPNSFQGKYFTPSLALFKHYTENLFTSTNLHTQWKQTEISSIELENNNFWTLHTKHLTSITTKYVILALGTERPNIPPLCSNTILEKKHILHPQFNQISHMPKKHIAIIGGGMSGAQLALSLSKHHKITLIISHPLKKNPFDSNPCFIGPKCRNTFLSANNKEKINMLSKERYHGTLNPFVYEALSEAICKKNITIQISKLKKIHTKANIHTLTLHNKNTITVDDFILATGLLRKNNYIDSNPLLTDLVAKYNLPLNDDSLPLLENNSLEWVPHMFVSGQLAEMTLGPPSNNIIGAHLFCRTMNTIWNKW